MPSVTNSDQSSLFLYCLTGSCKVGEDLQGICWDRVSGTPFSGICTDRFCNAGWTCSCEGRTHLCPLVTSRRNVLTGINSDGSATCREETGKSAGAPVVELGNTTISTSRRGLLNNACSEIAWWYNGDLMGLYGTDPVITEANVEEEMAIRSTLTLLEFQPGDLLAFRYRNASYQCFSSFLRLNVNGVIMDTGSAGVTALFSRQHSNNWFSPSFNPIVTLNESEANPADFVPIRTQFLSTGLSMVPGVDYWQPPDGTEDHKISNFYFRVGIPPSS